MDFSIGELVTASTALVGAGVTWGALSHRLKDQGRRIGSLEKSIAKVEGFMQGARYRTSTKPKGIPTAEG